MTRVRITQIDGSLPNLALMRLARWHRDRGDEVTFRDTVERDLFEPAYDRVYGSAIFKFSKPNVERFRGQFPGAVIGGTGVPGAPPLEAVAPGIGAEVDYADYPDFQASVGFLTRGCRLRCSFCVVPEKEGRPYAENTVAGLWRGEPYPRHLHLLDNDFFGTPEWERHIADIRDGGFRVCFSQGINVRIINKRIAEALRSIEYRDTRFRRRRLYMAWDNLGDESRFFRGIDYLEAAGIPASHVMAYMLIGYDPDETFSDIEYRFGRMVERGILPYPMVYDRSVDLHRHFQRWAVTGLYRAVPFSEYKPNWVARANVPRAAKTLAADPGATTHNVLEAAR